MNASLRYIAVGTLALAASAANSTLIGYADSVVEYFDSGNGSLSCPEAQGGVYPPGATSPNCVSFDVVLDDDPGPTSDYISLPQYSFITLGFLNENIVDGIGDDIFISEVGNALERAQIFVSENLSTNVADFVFLGTANGNTISSFDLADIGFTGQVRAIKVLSLDNGGAPNAPGFDLAHIRAINFVTVPVPPVALLLLAPAALLIRRRSKTEQV